MLGSRFSGGRISTTYDRHLFHFQGLESSVSPSPPHWQTQTQLQQPKHSNASRSRPQRPKVTASSVADKDGALGTRYFEVTASPSPSSGRRSRPPALLACFPTDRPPALPAPRSWHSLRSLGLGLGLRCLVPSGHGHVSLALVAELLAVSAALPGLGNTRRAELRVI